MSKASPHDDTAAERSDGREQATVPPPQAQKKRRNPWIWICMGLAVVAAGLLIWALTIQSDLDSSEQDVADLQSQLEQSEETGSALLGAAKALYDDFAQQIGATTEDLAATQQDLDEAEQAAAKAEEDAAAAEQDAAEAGSETDKARAEADKLKAEAQAAESKAAVAADCGKAYVSAFGALFEGDSVREQAATVRPQLESITAECKAALGGG
jgi:uncharacterized protein (DUF3084 family)